MKSNAFKFLAAVAILAIAVGCANTQQKESALVASGFKVITPNTPAQQAKLKTLKADKVSMVQKKGKMYYIFPDPANNRAYVGGPKEYQAYKALRAQQKIATEKLEAAEMNQTAAEMNQDTAMNWGAWGGWGGWGPGFGWCY